MHHILCMSIHGKPVGKDMNGKEMFDYQAGLVGALKSYTRYVERHGIPGDKMLYPCGNHTITVRNFMWPDGYTEETSIILNAIQGHNYEVLETP